MSRHIFPVGDPWFDFLPGEYVISIEIFQREVLREFIPFISKLLYVSTIRLLRATCLCISKFLLHWFRDSFETASNSKFELYSELQYTLELFKKKRSGIRLYSRQSYETSEREIPRFISPLVKFTWSFPQFSKYNFSSFASLILDLWYTITYNITNYCKYFSKIIKNRAKKKFCKLSKLHN